jgi:signal transduction histidine kinase
MDPRRRPRLIDARIAAGFIAVGQLEVWLAPAIPSRWRESILILVATGALFGRRRAPRAALAVGVCGNLALASTETGGAGLSAVVSVMLLQFSVGRELDVRRAWVGPPVALAAALFQIVALGGPAEDLVFILLLFAGPWVFGYALRLRAQRLDDATERADRAELQRDALARAAVAAERARIARELHDVVAHAISVVAIQAQAIRGRLGPPHESEAEDLRAVEVTARQAMTELRRLFGVLRSSDDGLPLAPQPGLGQLARLIDDTRATGLEIEVGIEGEIVALSPGLDLAGYRIVQEALTNVVRHAGAAHASVGIRYSPHALELCVEDDGRGLSTPADGDGRGLVGIRERVDLYGGTLQTGPRPQGGFRVAAQLPLDPAVNA